eukprot:1429978-Rhodomonas_salina.1
MLLRFKVFAHSVPSPVLKEAMPLLEKAEPGTEVGYGTAQSPTYMLCWYALSSTDIGYAATRCYGTGVPPVTWVSIPLSSYAMSAYGATTRTLLVLSVSHNSLGDEATAGTISLRPHYAMPCTESYCSNVVRVPYAISGTDLAYAATTATRSPVDTSTLCVPYAISDTELRYDATTPTRCPVLTYGMVRYDATSAVSPQLRVSAVLTYYRSPVLVLSSRRMLLPLRVPYAISGTELLYDATSAVPCAVYACVCSRLSRHRCQ